LQISNFRLRLCLIIVADWYPNRIKVLQEAARHVFSARGAAKRETMTPAGIEPSK
jgi:hypothetical protein